VLLAEDHPTDRRVLVHQLRIIGFHVDTAEDGRKASICRRWTGFELADAIRRYETETGQSRTPIMALRRT
jgi:DNA-binding response OmpR family regulator